MLLHIKEPTAEQQINSKFGRILRLNEKFRRLCPRAAECLKRAYENRRKSVAKQL